MRSHSSLLPLSLLLIGLGSIFGAERIVSEGDLYLPLLGAGALAFLAAAILRALGLTDAAKASPAAARARTLLMLAYGGVGVALLLYGLSTEPGLDVLGFQGTARERMDGALGAIWLAVMVPSLLALLPMEISLRRMPVREAIEARRVGAAGMSGLSYGFAVVFLIAINFVADARDVKRDLSYFKTSRPSEASLALARKLDEDVRIYLVYPQVNEVLDQIRPFFAEISAASRHAKVSIRDHALDPELARKHRVPGNGYVLMVRGQGESAQSERFEVGTELEIARSRLRTLDGRFKESFLKITRPPRSLHLTVGHGERTATGAEGDGPGDKTTVLADYLSQLNVTTSPLGIAQGLASAVPEDARAVALLGPRSKVSPEEAEVLLAYVRRGGRLLITVDPNVDSGLAPLLEGLGVEMLPGVLASERRYRPRFRTNVDRANVYTNEFSSHPSVSTASRRPSEVAAIFVQGGGLAAKPGATPAPQVTFPVRASADIWRDLDENYERSGTEAVEPVNLMAAVSIRTGGEEGRAVVIADGDFATDKVLPNPGNTVILIDSIRWLIGEEEIPSDVSSEEDVRIEHTRDEDKLWFYLTTFGAPVPVALIGLWVAKRRRTRGETRR